MMRIPSKLYLALAAIGIGVAFAFVQFRDADKPTENTTKVPPHESHNHSFTIAPYVERSPLPIFQMFDSAPRPIRGSVIGPDRKPVPKANVWVVGGDKRPSQQIVADDEGKFETVLTGFDWLVAASPDGLLESRGDSVGVAGVRIPIWPNRTAPPPPMPPLEVMVQPRDRWSLPVQVVDPKGNPVKDVKLILQQDWLDEVGKTNDQGKAVVPIRRDSESWNLFAYKPGYGYGHLGFETNRYDNSPRFNRYPADVIQKATNEWIQKNPDPVKIQLTETRPIHVHVVDQSNRPVPGVVISPPHYMNPPDFDQITDGEGNATFDYLQINRARRIGLIEFDISFNRFPAADQQSRFYPIEPFKWDPNSKNDNLTFRVAKMVPIRGRVLDDQGNPIAGAAVKATNSLAGGQSTSKDDGSYEIYLRPGDGYTVIASADKAASAPTKHFRLEYETPIDGIDLTIISRAQVTFIGSERIIDPGSKLGRRECVVLSYESLPSAPFDPLAKNAAWNLAHIHPQNMGGSNVNQDRFTCSLGPGAYMFLGRPWQDPIIFRITDSEPRTITVPDPPDFPGESVLTGVVLDANGKPIPNAQMHIYPANSLATGAIWERTDHDGRFSIKRPKVPAVVDARIGKGASIQLIDADTTTVELRPNQLISVHGQFGILPPLRSELHWHVRLAMPISDTSNIFAWPISFEGHIFDGGEFSIHRVPIEIPLELQISRDRRNWYSISRFKADGPHDHKLGKIELDPDVIDAALDDPVAIAFRSGRNPTSMHRLSDVFHDAKRSKLPVVIIAGNPEGPLCKELSLMLKKDRSFLDKCHLIGLPISAPFREDSHAFLPWLDVDVQDAKRLVIAVAAPDGTLLNRWKPSDFAEGDHLDRAKLKALSMTQLKQ